MSGWAMKPQSGSRGEECIGIPWTEAPTGSATDFVTHLVATLTKSHLAGAAALHDERT